MFPCFIWRFLLKVRKPDSQSGNGLFDSAKRHQYGVMDKGKSLDSQSRGAWSFHAHVTNMVRSTSGLGRRPLKAETHVRIVRESPYGCLDKGKSPASQAGGGGSYATSNHHLPITQSALCKILTIHASGSAVRCFPTEQ